MAAPQPPAPDREMVLLQAAAVVVIGASQGGVEALRSLAAQLRPEIPAAWCVVLHVGPQLSVLPSLLERAGPLPARHLEDGEALRGGRIYLAPPDRHFLIKDGRGVLSHGPRENWARPAIDPLFRTAAQVHGRRVIGVILTGNLNDGTAGLLEVKRRGGIAVVQDPDDAMIPQMPVSALRHVAVDHRVPLAEMGALLSDLVSKMPAPEAERAMEAMAMSEGYRLDRPVTLSCPECAGVMGRETTNGLVQYRCHIGHVLTADAMLEAQLRSLEHRLGSCLSLVNEQAELLRQTISGGDEQGHDQRALEAALQQALERAETLRAMLERPWGHPERS